MKSQRHHIIPKFLLNNFTDENGNLYFYNGKDVVNTSIKDGFIRKNFYAQRGQDGHRNFDAETKLSKSESKSAPIINKIIEAGRKRNCPGLTDSERNLLDKFFVIQWMRTPIMRDTVMPDLQKGYRNILDDFEREKRPLIPSERSELTEETEMKRRIYNAHVQCVPIPSEEVLQCLKIKGIGLCVITNPKKSFIIGDFPIIKITSQGSTQLSDPTVEVWLPISYDIILAYAAFYNPENLIFEDRMERIREINRTVAKQSNVIAGRSELLVKSLVSL